MTTGRYARDTDVSPEQSIMEIRQILRRYNATGFGMVETNKSTGIAFEMQNRRVRFIMPMPDKSEFMTTRSGARRTGVQLTQSVNKEHRRRWRSLVLVIKAKLESVESGVETFEEAFMAQLVLPNGQTMAEWAAPQITAGYQGGMPPMLPEGK